MSLERPQMMFQLQPASPDQTVGQTMRKTLYMF